MTYDIALTRGLVQSRRRGRAAEEDPGAAPRWWWPSAACACFAGVNRLKTRSRSEDVNRTVYGDKSMDTMAVRPIKDVSQRSTRDSVVARVNKAELERICSSVALDPGVPVSAYAGAASSASAAFITCYVSTRVRCAWARSSRGRAAMPRARGGLGVLAAAVARRGPQLPGIPRPAPCPGASPDPREIAERIALAASRV